MFFVVKGWAYCGVFSSNLGLYPLEARNTPHPIPFFSLLPQSWSHHNKNVFTYCQISPGDRGKVITVENYYVRPCPIMSTWFGYGLYGTGALLVLAQSLTKMFFPLGLWCVQLFSSISLAFHNFCTSERLNSHQPLAGPTSFPFFCSFFFFNFSID